MEFVKVYINIGKCNEIILPFALEPLLWEKLLIVAVKQLLEQNRHNQVGRRLLDSSSKNGCKE